MSSHFDVLGLVPSLCLSEDEINRRLARSEPGTSSRCRRIGIRFSTRINEARNALLRPSGLLAEWLKSRGVSVSVQNAAIGNSLMDLFSRINSSLQAADEVSASLEKSQTALAKSLLSKKAIDAQLEVQARLGELGKFTDQVVSRFPEFESSAAEENDFRKPKRLSPN